MEFHLAQVNIGKILGPIDSPVMAEFVANLDRINALAENSEGFVWRLKDDSNNATSIKVYDDDMIIVNMSVGKILRPCFSMFIRVHMLKFLKGAKNGSRKCPKCIWYYGMLLQVISLR
ncbi:hypothetical protein GGD38_000526 [Chitinophagaceae bacterium OAS944]|nr:hypothetical protein [Chitinophagaceae bacterium OAS944]